MSHRWESGDKRELSSLRLGEKVAWKERVFEVAYIHPETGDCCLSAVERDVTYGLLIVRPRDAIALHEAIRRAE